MFLFNLFLALQQSQHVLPRAAQPPVIDGVIGESEWKGSLLFDKWVQTKPGDNTAPEGRTVASLLYDHSNIYIAVRAWDDPARVR